MPFPRRRCGPSGYTISPLSCATVSIVSAQGWRCKASRCVAIIVYELAGAVSRQRISSRVHHSHTGRGARESNGSLDGFVVTAYVGTRVDGSAGRALAQGPELKEQRRHRSENRPLSSPAGRMSTVLDNGDAPRVQLGQQSDLYSLGWVTRGAIRSASVAGV